VKLVGSDEIWVEYYESGTNANDDMVGRKVSTPLNEIADGVSELCSEIAEALNETGTVRPIGEQVKEVESNA